MDVEGGETEGQKQIAVAFPRDCCYKDGGSSQGRRVKSGSNGKIGGNKQLSFKTISLFFQHTPYSKMAANKFFLFAC